MQNLAKTVSNNAVLPQHLVALDRGRWFLWRCIGLRGAGFPANLLLKLASESCAAAAEEYLAAEAETERAFDAALESMRQQLEATTSPEDRYRLIDAIQQLKKGKVPGNLSLEDLERAKNRKTLAQENFQKHFAGASEDMGEALREIAELDKFQEAIIWQNRRAFHTGVESFLRHQSNGANRNSKQRQYEQLISNYAQRYCAKNDTIGFFGPVGWARIDGDESSITTTIGPDFLAQRTVYFENWCIDALVNTLNERGIRRWVAPRLNPTMRVEGASLMRPQMPLLPLSAQDASLLAACDGVRTAATLTATLNEITEAEVLKRLEEFRELGFISWDLELPIGPYPERDLKCLLDRVGDAELKDWGLSRLRELEEGRMAIARAAGNPRQLDQAMKELESTFTSVTNRAATKSAGKNYAGRTLVYEDCRRDIDVRIGEGALHSVDAPLSLLLTAARWLTFELARNFKQICREVYLQLGRSTDHQKIDFFTFWQQTQPIIFGAPQKLREPIAAKFQQRWAEVLKLDNRDRVAHFAVEQIRSRVEEAFHAPNPGWAYARYHSPDVLLFAESPEALAKGDFKVVLGELHVAANTLGWPLFIEQHESPQDLFDALEQDFTAPRVVPVIPKQMFGPVARVMPALISQRDYHIALSPDPVDASPSQVLPISGLIVEEDGSDGLCVTTRDHSLQFDIVEVYADILTPLIANEFKMLPFARHTPRVEFDRLVACREAWHFNPDDLTFASLQDESARFIDARRWAHEQQLPRFVFVKVPVELKPFFVDFDSPVFVEILSKMVRRTIDNSPSDALITMSEMLPGLDQCWLPDAEGNVYTCELRMVAVDAAPSRQHARKEEL
ncbi:MAG TPA: lantibiotic dehydratase [Pyrinomonadaceae bacterium]|nr:lantibiotic dehydratase [Pyrinomonadaceae bacterium]